MKVRLQRTLSCSGDAKCQIVQTQRYPREVLFALGGWHDGAPTNHMEVYDIRMRKWSVITHFPEFIDESPRAYHAVVYVDGWLFMIGGFDGQLYYDKVRKYHFESQRWEGCSRMYQKRCYVSAAHLGGKIYACGGLDGQHRLNTAEVFDIKSNSWDHLPSMNNHRSDASSAAYNERIFICGGFSGQSCLNSVETYSPGAASWTQITPMCSPRSGVVCIVHQGKLWALGGFDGTDRLKSTEFYDETGWKIGPQMNKERSNFAGSSVGEHIFICGGYNEVGTLKSVESLRFDPEGHPTIFRKEEKMNIDRSALQSVVVDDLSRERISQLLPRRSPIKSKAGLITKYPFKIFI